jgi:hypothetical protein
MLLGYFFDPNARRAGKSIGLIDAVAEQHEVARVFQEMVQYDGVGTWPPHTNHNHLTWPQALQAYRDIYMELAPLLPRDTPSLDDQVNTARIMSFRDKFRNLLSERVNLDQVKEVYTAHSTFSFLKHLEKAGD